jgi:hypothetical protein
VIAAHIAINLVIEPWLLLSSINGRWDTSTHEPVSDIRVK